MDVINKPTHLKNEKPPVIQANNKINKFYVSKLTVSILFFILALLLGSAGGYFIGTKVKMTPPSSTEQQSSIDQNQLSEKEQISELVANTIMTGRYWYSPDNTKMALLVYEMALRQSQYENVINGTIYFIDLLNNEKFEVDYFDLIPKDVLLNLDSLLSVPMLNMQYLGWSSDSRHFWGVIEITPQADPPLTANLFLFRIDTTSYSSGTFEIPFSGYTSSSTNRDSIAFNVESKKVLFDNISSDDTLSLYLYDLTNNKLTTIASYPKDTLNKYLGNMKYVEISYYYPGEENRKLEYKWVDNNTISYKDFETREEVTYQIDR